MNDLKHVFTELVNVATTSAGPVAGETGNSQSREVCK